MADDEEYVMILGEHNKKPKMRLLSKKNLSANEMDTLLGGFDEPN